MALTNGYRLGSYEILALIGVGSMGEVYRGRDTRVNREVAVKVLPDSTGLDPERVARFRREASLLASLNHPNIAHVHGLEEADGAHALVMELVEGPTLAERLTRGGMPLNEALRVAKQIAQALEAAHAQGVVHRDLKPANIKVRGDGVVKVGFGLAKFQDAVLRTAAYMSPEQASGKPIDRRADIWAFGAILYEMLTGRVAFPGETVPDTIASVMSRDVDWTALSPAPARIHDLVRRSLDRDVSARLQDIASAVLELGNSLAPPA